MSRKRYKHIIILGAAGSLGYELCGRLLEQHYNIAAVDVSENNLAYLDRSYNIPTYIEDIRSFDKMKGMIEYLDTDLVINCAALKHVKWCDDNMYRAIEVNIIANLELMNHLSKLGKDFIYISSDKAIKPTNAYALTKQFTDYVVNYFNFKLVRGVNFLNSKGSVLDIWEKQRKQNLPFTVVKENCQRYFITLSQMADLVISAVEDEGDKVEYIPDMVFKIYIKEMFKAYLELCDIKDYTVHDIYLMEGEKMVEDLNFSPQIIELNDVNDIRELLRKVII